jgi:hypothetical protein
LKGYQTGSLSNLKIAAMKTNDQNSGNGNKTNDTAKQRGSINNNQPQKDKNVPNKRSGISHFIKDMPPIDGARPGIL